MLHKATRAFKPISFVSAINAFAFAFKTLAIVFNEANRTLGSQLLPPQLPVKTLTAP